MTSSITIPKRKNRPLAGHDDVGRSARSSGSSASSSSSSSPGFSYGTYGRSFGSSVASPAASVAGTPTQKHEREKEMRRQSLMSASFSKAEHTVINVGDSESPRLITCVKASQGFDWNQEIFLPSYADHHFDNLELRQDPVEDIILTDEEMKNIFPS